MRSSACPNARNPSDTAARAMTSAAPMIGTGEGSAPRSPSASERITKPKAIPAHVAAIRRRTTPSSVALVATDTGGGGTVAVRSVRHQLGFG
jgi:hypothetical protein